MSSRNLDFFSTFLEGGRGTYYGPTLRTVKRTILEALGLSKRLRYKALWRETSAYGVTGAQFTAALRELRDDGAVSIDLAGDPTDPDIALTPGGTIAAGIVADIR